MSDREGEADRMDNGRSDELRPHQGKEQIEFSYRLILALSCLLRGPTRS